MQSGQRSGVLDKKIQQYVVLCRIMSYMWPQMWRSIEFTMFPRHPFSLVRGTANIGPTQKTWPPWAPWALVAAPVRPQSPSGTPQWTSVWSSAVAMSGFGFQMPFALGLTLGALTCTVAASTDLWWESNDQVIVHVTVSVPACCRRENLESKIIQSIYEMQIMQTLVSTKVRRTFAACGRLNSVS